MTPFTTNFQNVALAKIGAMGYNSLAGMCLLMAKDSVDSLVYYISEHCSYMEPDDQVSMAEYFLGKARLYARVEFDRVSWDLVFFTR